MTSYSEPSAPSTTPSSRSPFPAGGGGEDWPGLLRFAVLRLGIAPEAFWRLSLKEWRALTEDAGPTGLGRRELERLMREHPDEL